MKRGIYTPPPYELPSILKMLGFAEPPRERECRIVRYDDQRQRMALIQVKVQPHSILAILARRPDAKDLWDVPQWVPASEVYEVGGEA